MIPPWKDAESEKLKKIRGICFDIDDTFSTSGKILPEAYQALWNLKDKGFPLVPITGRPAGWCDHIARFWPVDAVVGENGAFVFFMENQKLSRLDTPMNFSLDESKEKLKNLSQKIKEAFPKAHFASDQAYREFDLAIDFCEDVPPWEDQEVNRLIEFCRSQGAHVKKSSIHVNAWFGDYDKFSGFKNWLKKKNPLSLEKWVFVGDSPNDEPLFEAFSMSVGVANLKPFLSEMKFSPSWMTEKKSGEGFCELANRLLKL